MGMIRRYSLQHRVASGLFLAASLLAMGILRAATPVPAGWRQLTAMFDSVMTQDQMVGGSIALVRDGKIVEHREFGLADRTAGARVTPDTIFHWASNTKTLNAIGVMQLRDRGLLRLDQPITRYVPELRRVHNAYGSMDAITISMLLSHTAGFQDSTWPYKNGVPWEPFEPTHWEQLVAMMPYQEIGFAPGSRFSYSNPAWIYLAHMVEGLTDDPWVYYIQKNIFTPLGMSRSFFNTTPPHLSAQRSHSYGVRKDDAGKIVVDDYGAEFDPGVTIPNGGWNAPLADIATYIGFLTHATHGDPQTGRVYESVLRHSTLEEMWQPRATVDWERDSKITTSPAEKMGLGFFLNERGGHRIVGHTGGQNGYSTFFYCDPITGLGVIGAINTGNGARAEGAHSAFGILLGQALTVFE
jgi:CubicO group peptidase (beta-lactamase class C family)